MSSEHAPSGAMQPPAELASELEAFRTEWKREAAQRRLPPAPALAPPAQSAPPPPPPASAPAPPLAADPAVAEVQDDLDGLSLGDHRDPRWRGKRSSAAPPPPKSAVELYGQAVDAEREGRLNDALQLYRQAFRLDADVDKHYHRSLQTALSPASPTRAAATPSTGSAAPTSDAFAFERTVQLTPDYVAEREQRSAAAVREGMGRTPAHAVEEEDQHPSSTRFLLTSLLRSFERHPFVPVAERQAAVEGAQPDTHGTESAPFVVRFWPADEQLPLYLSMLPHEVLLLILRQLVFSSVTPPPKPKPDHPPAVGKKGQPKPTVREEREKVELELGLVGFEGKAKRPWKMDVEALERFARTCRAARVLTLDDGIWRGLCERTYVPPHQISREEDAERIVMEQHAGDWRRCFIEHPRIRFDGCYIAVVTYLRRGDTHQSWYSPTHVITFYRLLRFYRSGLVLSYLTVEPPSDVVKRLNPSLRAKGLTRGRWRLRGDLVEAWRLEDLSVKDADRKYSFRMSCRLKSTARGRMNKLEMISLATEHRLTRELEDVPIKPTKPFYFSKVASYAALDE